MTPDVIFVILLLKRIHTHIFSQCEQLHILWEFLDEVLSLVGIHNNDFSFVKNREMYDFFFLDHGFFDWQKKFFLNQVPFDEICFF